MNCWYTGALPTHRCHGRSDATRIPQDALAIFLTNAAPRRETAPYICRSPIHAIDYRSGDAFIPQSQTEVRDSERGARGTRLPFPVQDFRADSATEATPAIEARAPAPAVISNEAGIGVARTVVTAGIVPRARIPSGDVAWSSAFHSAAFNILLRDGLKRLLALRGVNPNGIQQTEAELRFRLENCGAAPGQENCSNPRHGTGSCANGRAGAPIRCGADRCTKPCGSGYGGGILSVRRSARALGKLSKNGHLTALHEGHVGELDAEFGGALDAAGFANFFHFANDGLAAAGYNPSVNDERLIECGGELIADLVPVGGEEIVSADYQDGAGGDRQGAGNGLGRGWRRRSVLGVLARPVVRIRRFVGILRGVRGSGRRVLCLLRPVALRLVLRLLGVDARAEAKCESKCACALPNGTEAPRLCWVVYHDLFSLDLDSFQSSARSPLGAIG